MDSIRNIGQKVGGWVANNVTGDKKAKSKDYTPVDPKAKDIHDSYERIGDKVDKIDKEVSNIADLSELKPPTLADVSDKNLVILGVAGGGAVGAALKTVEGVITTALDSPEIEVTKTEHDIKRPVLKGADGLLTEDNDSAGNLLGQHHKFTPRIEYEKVGDYKTVEGKVVHTVDGDSPVMSGVKGLVGGAAIGGGIALSVAVGRKLLKKGQYVPKESREIEGEGKVIAGAAGIGAVGGAAAAGLGGIIEAGHGDVKEISFKQPVMEKQTIGQIPQDHYHSVYEVIREDNIPKKDVVMEGPKMEKGLLGEKPVMEKVNTTVEIKPRFGVMGQILGGAVLGAIGGALAGIVVNVLRKII